MRCRSTGPRFASEFLEADTRVAAKGAHDLHGQPCFSRRESRDRARDAGWCHEEYLAAVLSREVSERETSGAALRIKAARFPGHKTLEDFNLDHQPRRPTRTCLARLHATAPWTRVPSHLRTFSLQGDRRRLPRVSGVSPDAEGDFSRRGQFLYELSPMSRYPGWITSHRLRKDSGYRRYNAATSSGA